MPSAVPENIADAIRAVGTAKTEKDTADQLLSDATLLAETAKRMAEAAEKQIKAAETPEQKEIAQQKAVKAGATAQRAEEVRQAAEKNAAYKAAVEKASEAHLANLRAGKRADEEENLSAEIRAEKCNTTGSTVREPALRWFPKVIIPLIFVYILAYAFITAEQIPIARQWETVSEWFTQTFQSERVSAEAEEKPTETIITAESQTADYPGTLSIGEKAATDLVQVTLNWEGVSDVVILKPGNWLNPVNETALAAGDGRSFVCFTFTVLNLSDETLESTDFCNVSVNANGVRYTGAEYGVEISPDSTGNSDLFDNVELLAPQDSRNYYGYILCAQNPETDGDNPLLVNFNIPGSEGEKEFSYLCGEAAVSSEKKNVAEMLQALKENLTFIQQHAGEKDEDGSMAFDSEIISSTRNGLDGLDEDYVNQNLPDTAARLPMIQNNLKSICDKLEVMSISNSAGNVEKIQSLASQTIALIQGLLDSELKT